MPESTVPLPTPSAPVASLATGGDQIASSVNSNSWPERCTLAELARILTMMYGGQAPSESSLKKWSSSGVFNGCVVVEPLTEQQALPSFTREALLRPRRAGRPGHCLDTGMALEKVYEQWPHLTETAPDKVLQLAVARVSDHLQGVMKSLVPAAAATTAPGPTPSGVTALPPAAASPLAVAASPAAGASETQLDRIERLVDALVVEVAVIKREMAQVSSPRNNLLTKLDDAVTRAQQALASGTRGTGGDPLAEAKRERDMGVLKGMMGEILGRLETLGAKS
ncbi:hypothetical protein [uncultured Variovorax sp.]|uniref:hypothetical protein n=1 Tax=uncultured Variovorax sp. TaxID=114708 RepID=UPI00261CECD7|nr:hypothetical protein [uncultured Variovorax sp.]